MKYDADTGGLVPSSVTICCGGPMSRAELYFVVDGCPPGALPMSWAVLMSLRGYAGRHRQPEGRYFVRGSYLLACLNYETETEGWRRHAKAVLGPGIDRFLEKAGGAAALGLGGEAAQQLAAILAHLG
jgi:hypothetical protein